MNLTLQMLLDEGSSALSEAGIGEAVLDAKLLLFEAFGTDMTHFIMDRNARLRDEDSVERAVADYRRLIARRSGRIPLQQITGCCGFMGLDFYVNEHVLIPRQDTETLVEEVLKDIGGRDSKVLDMCAGSGCIGLSLLVLGGFREVVEADISMEALKVTKRNAERMIGNKLRTVHAESRQLSEQPWGLELSGKYNSGSGMKEFCVKLLESDLFSSFTEGQRERFDVIVSNPPYIPSAVIEGLEPEVKDHEPRLALDGSDDGLIFYRRLAGKCPDYLNPGGAVYFEIGYDQGEAVSALLREAGFERVCVIKDAPGHDRVVKGILC